MTLSLRRAALGFGIVALAVVALAVRARFQADLAAAAARAAQGSVLLQTRCGPIEVQEAGTGLPLLMVHGNGGGHDQGMAFAGRLAQHGICVVAVSRFGYLRSPMPADGSPEAQADAHACVLDALGIQRAAVLGASAGGPSALQAAIRHPDRVSALVLVLVVPIAYRPRTVADSAPPLPPWAEAMLMRLIGSDFLFWAGLEFAPDQVIRHVLATPPGQVAAASPQERARVHAMAEQILPVSSRAQGLATTRCWAVACGLMHWSAFAPPLCSSARVTTATPPMPAASTPPAGSRAPGPSASTTAGTCWWDTKSACSPRSSIG